MTNHLAAELRGILAELEHFPTSDRLPVVQRRLRQLIWDVERLGDQPDDAATGVIPVQAIRADALLAAARLLAPALANQSLLGLQANEDTISHVWLALAGRGADWVQAVSDA